ncbi:MAG TPA: hypothetical protein VNR18_01970 [Hyphomicrobiales bacterium]|nr:hypothetical protein [Hyphomicrobiales bacterium]
MATSILLGRDLAEIEPVSALAPHTRANREFFEPGCAPTRHTWADWIRRGVVQGKLIDNRPYVDLNAFAVANVLEPEIERPPQLTGLDLLAGSNPA